MKTGFISIAVFVLGLCLAVLIVFCGFICYQFGFAYFLHGRYYFDTRTDIPREMYPPTNYFGQFTDETALSSLSMIRVALNVPKVAEYYHIHDVDQWNNRMIPPDPIQSIEPVWGKDGKIYAVFFHMKHPEQMTILCFINLRYARQWRCLFDSSLIRVPYLPSNAKCWSCIAHYYGQVRDTIWKRWNEYYRDHTKQLIILGHSLGGALSPLCALDLKLNDSSKYFQKHLGQPYVVISGAPQVGSAQFAQTYNELVPKTFNIMNNFDIIGMTPITNPPHQIYEHVGEIVPVGNTVVKRLPDHHYLTTYYDHFLKKIQK